MQCFVSPRTYRIAVGNEVFACTHATAGYVRQARTHSGPAQDVPRGIQVPIDCEPTVSAPVQALAERFRDFHAAAGTIRAGVIRIHFDQAGTSIFCFVPEHRDELRPRSIMDVLGQGASRQALHIQLFHGDHVVVTHEARGRLVQVVEARPGELRMVPGECHARLASASAAPHLACERAVCLPKPPFRSPRGFQGWNEPAVGEGGRSTALACT